MAISNLGQTNPFVFNPQPLWKPTNPLVFNSGSNLPQSIQPIYSGGGGSSSGGSSSTYTGGGSVGGTSVVQPLPVFEVKKPVTAKDIISQGNLVTAKIQELQAKGRLDYVYAKQDPLFTALELQAKGKVDVYNRQQDLFAKKTQSKFDALNAENTRLAAEQAKLESDIAALNAQGSSVDVYSQKDVDAYNAKIEDLNSRASNFENKAKEFESKAAGANRAVVGQQIMAQQSGAKLNAELEKTNALFAGASGTTPSVDLVRTKTVSQKDIIGLESRVQKPKAVKPMPNTFFGVETISPFVDVGGKLIKKEKASATPYDVVEGLPKPLKTLLFESPVEKAVYPGFSKELAMGAVGFGLGIMSIPGQAIKEGQLFGLQETSTKGRLLGIAKVPAKTALGMAAYPFELGGSVLTGTKSIPYAVGEVAPQFLLPRVIKSSLKFSKGFLESSPKFTKQGIIYGSEKALGQAFTLERLTPETVLREMKLQPFAKAKPKIAGLLPEPFDFEITFPSQPLIKVVKVPKGFGITTQEVLIKENIFKELKPRTVAEVKAPSKVVRTKVPLLLEAPFEVTKPVKPTLKLIKASQELSGLEKLQASYLKEDLLASMSSKTFGKKGLVAVVKPGQKVLALPEPFEVFKPVKPVTKIVKASSELSGLQKLQANYLKQDLEAIFGKKTFGRKQVAVANEFPDYFKTLDFELFGKPKVKASKLQVGIEKELKAAREFQRKQFYAQRFNEIESKLPRTDIELQRTMQVQLIKPKVVRKQPNVLKVRQPTFADLQLKSLGLRYKQKPLVIMQERLLFEDILKGRKQAKETIRQKKLFANFAAASTQPAPEPPKFKYKPFVFSKKETETKQSGVFGVSEGKVVSGGKNGTVQLLKTKTVEKAKPVVVTKVEIGTTQKLNQDLRKLGFIRPITTQQGTGFAVLSRQESLEVPEIVLKQPSISKVFTVQGFKPVQIQSQSLGLQLKQLQASKVKVVTIQSQSLKQFQAQQLKPVQVLKPKQITTTKLSTQQKQKGIQKFAKAYNVFLRQKAGGEFKLYAAGLSKESALAVGSQKARKLEKASFRILPTQGIGKNVLDFDAGKFYKQFRESKSKKLAGVYVELPKYRINEPVEFEKITQKGLAALAAKRRKKKGSWF